MPIITGQAGSGHIRFGKSGGVQNPTVKPHPDDQSRLTIIQMEGSRFGKQQQLKTNVAHSRLRCGQNREEGRSIEVGPRDLNTSELDNVMGGFFFPAARRLDIMRTQKICFHTLSYSGRIRLNPMRLGNSWPALSNT